MKHPTPCSPAGHLQFVLLILATLFSLFPAGASAQPDLPTTSGGTTTGSSRITGRENISGEFMMDVNIWGFVKAPGKYTVPVSTRLVDLISLAGGPAERAELDQVKIIHDLNVDSTLTQTVVLINVAEYQQTGLPEANPVLYPSDTVIIPGDSLNSFNEILSIVSNIAVVTISVIGLIFAFDRN